MFAMDTNIHILIRYMRENEAIENIEYAVTMEPIIYDADYIPATETKP